MQASPRRGSGECGFQAEVRVSAQTGASTVACGSGNAHSDGTSYSPASPHQTFVCITISAPRPSGISSSASRLPSHYRLAVSARTITIASSPPALAPSCPRTQSSQHPWHDWKKARRRAGRGAAFGLRAYHWREWIPARPTSLSHHVRYHTSARWPRVPGPYPLTDGTSISDAISHASTHPPYPRCTSHPRARPARVHSASAVAPRSPHRRPPPRIGYARPHALSVSPTGAASAPAPSPTAETCFFKSRADFEHARAACRQRQDASMLRTVCRGIARLREKMGGEGEAGRG
ncbi:hypothetical protein DFH09DRAFT_415018 [Mycena vulgaris]|nr:hypothetical protein DFH09DRAFT_415018 [Mycena vulgaris]